MQKFNTVDQSIISRCIGDYNSYGAYDTDTMNKAKPDRMVNLLQPIIESVVDKKLSYVGGNFYKHSRPYLPHTDYKINEANRLNVVIPLSYTHGKPSLVIFDQRWNFDSVTWCMQYPVQHFTYNTGVKGCPAEYPIEGNTNKEIDQDLYQAHLAHYPKDLLFGLSGSAFPFEIGSVIVFDNRLIHCTSNFTGDKLGITLRFK